MNEVVDIERKVIGQILFDGLPAILKSLGIVDEEDFYEPRHRVLFGVGAALAFNNKSVGIVEVDQYMKTERNSIMAQVQNLNPHRDYDAIIKGLSVYAAELAGLHTSYPDRLQSYCTIIRTESRRRRLHSVLDALRNKIVECQDVDAAVDIAIRDLMEISVTSQSRKTLKLSDAIRLAEKEIRDELGGVCVRLPTGFGELDRIISGLEKGRLYVVAAEEKIGKSILANQIALHIAKNGYPAAIVSLEMRASELAKRYAGVHVALSLQEQLRRINTFQSEAANLPLYVRDGSATPEEVVAVARKLHVEYGIRLLLIDYLQLVDIESTDRLNELNRFVAQLKRLAMELELPVILIAGVLNKQISARNNRKPTPADIRDTGRLANDADCLIMMWKPDEEDDQYIEVFVARSRYSPCGRIGLRMDLDSLALHPADLKGAMPRQHKAFVG